jgi:hypothetical protein
MESSPDGIILSTSSSVSHNHHQRTHRNEEPTLLLLGYYNDAAQEEVHILQWCKVAGQRSPTTIEYRLKKLARYNLL